MDAPFLLSPLVVLHPWLRIAADADLCGYVITAVDQVKQHIDQGLSSLALEIKELRSSFNAVSNRQQSSLPPASFISYPTASTSLLDSNRPSDQQFSVAAQQVLEATSPRSHAATFPLPPSPLLGDVSAAGMGSAIVVVDAQSNGLTNGVGATGTKAIVDVLKRQHSEVQSLRHEISVLRQTYTDFVTSTKALFVDLRAQSAHFRSTATTTTTSTKGSSERAFVAAGRIRLESESTELIIKGDEVQDSIDQLRSDLSLRQIRPSPTQLLAIARTLREVNEQRDALVGWIATVTPAWRTTWAEELQVIISEQGMLRAQEGMLGELKTDLEEAGQLLGTIRQVAKEQPSLSSSSSIGNGRQRGGASQRELATNGADGDPVLQEVRGLQPDTASRRLEAIAESERRRELANANRSDELTDELGAFVGEGRLRKSGGIEEAERVRQARSEATLKAMFAS